MTTVTIEVIPADEFDDEEFTFPKPVEGGFRPAFCTTEFKARKRIEEIYGTDVEIVVTHLTDKE